MTVEEATKAKQALERQIPKKPRQGINEPFCPICEMNFFVRDQPYCANCGQKIDWRNDDDS